MSRVDELRRLSADPCGYFERYGGPLVLFDQAREIIHELEADRSALLAIVRADSRCDFAQAARLIAALPESLKKEVQGV